MVGTLYWEIVNLEDFEGEEEERDLEDFLAEVVVSERVQTVRREINRLTEHLIPQALENIDMSVEERRRIERAMVQATHNAGWHGNRFDSRKYLGLDLLYSESTGRLLFQVTDEGRGLDFEKLTVTAVGVTTALYDFGKGLSSMLEVFPHLRYFRSEFGQPKYHAVLGVRTIGKPYES
jgi:hypothetical protein